MHASAIKSKPLPAATWCEHATKHGGGKPWKYLLIPHEQIDDAKTLAGLAAMYEVKAEANKHIWYGAGMMPTNDIRMEA